MAIDITICDADIRQYLGTSRWIVRHPHNDAILAYCDTREEATRVRDAINGIPHLLREVGQTVMARPRR